MAAWAAALTCVWRLMTVLSRGDRRWLGGGSSFGGRQAQGKKGTPANRASSRGTTSRIGRVLIGRGHAVRTCARSCLNATTTMEYARAGQRAAAAVDTPLALMRSTMTHPLFSNLSIS